MDVNVSFVTASSWDENMPARMKWLRENDPVHWSEPDGLWVVSRFEDVSYVSKNQQLFTSARGVRPGNDARLGLIDEGEPRHGQLRKLINRGFTPRMVKKLEKAFREITTEAIDAIAKDGQCDFVHDIAVPLPLLLIAEMIGIRKEDRHRFHEWSDAMIAGDGNFHNPEIIAKAGAAFMAYSTYVTQIIESRRREPKDDLVSILVGAKDDGFLETFEARKAHGEMGFDEEHESLANDELVMLLVLLMVAGNETTRNALSGGMQLLIENPDQRQKLIDDPSLDPVRLRGDRAHRVAGALVLAHGARGHGAARRPAEGGPAGADALPVGEPRREPVPGPGSLRRRPATPSTWASGSARTSAWARTSPAWSCGWPSASCCAACPTWSTRREAR